MTIGYSEKSLQEKLGLTNNMSTLFLKTPPEYFVALGKRPQPYDDVDGEYDFIHAFYTQKQDLEGYADIMLSKLSEKGMLWVSWPKKSQKQIATDITEQDLRDILLPKGVVDVKVCAVTEVWSGLKFVRRKK